MMLLVDSFEPIKCYNEQLKLSEGDTDWWDVVETFRKSLIVNNDAVFKWYKFWKY